MHVENSRLYWRLLDNVRPKHILNIELGDFVNLFRVSNTPVDMSPFQTRAEVRNFLDVCEDKVVYADYEELYRCAIHFG